MCENDPTSIMISSDGTPQCLKAMMSKCKFDMHEMTQIDFDFSFKNCNRVWAAPLWISPDYWEGGVQSGEIDMVETCPTGHLSINFAGGDKEKRNLFLASNFDGHVTVINDCGNIAVTMCKGNQKCTQNSKYTGT